MIPPVNSLVRRGRSLDTPECLQFLNFIEKTMGKSVIIIGGGVAGMEAAACLSNLGVDVTLLEKNKYLGGHLPNWDRLFPSRRNGHDVLDYLEKGMNENVTIKLDTKIRQIKNDKRSFFIILETGESLKSDALLLTTGFDLFDARKKEEYGYGIYDNVITSAELEEIFQSGAEIKTTQGTTPKRIGIIHCVGSRDEKIKNLYCSKVCCVTGVKQAIEIREKLPDAEVYNFYMDMRMYDRNFEELYLESQQKWGVHFIRGRLSEASENPDHSLLLKVEDTLTGRPLKMTVDLVVLLIGFMPTRGSKELAGMIGLKPGTDGFLLPVDGHTQTNISEIPGVFLAGAVKGPTSIDQAITDARAAALQISEYLKGKKKA
jgi:heterodisulfide reductase subunit A2